MDCAGPVPPDSRGVVQGRVSSSTSSTASPCVGASTKRPGEEGADQGCTFPIRPRRTQAVGAARSSEAAFEGAPAKPGSEDLKGQRARHATWKGPVALESGSTLDDAVGAAVAGGIGSGAEEIAEAAAAEEPVTEVKVGDGDVLELQPATAEPTTSTAGRTPRQRRRTDRARSMSPRRVAASRRAVKATAGRAQRPRLDHGLILTTKASPRPATVPSGVVIAPRPSPSGKVASVDEVSPTT